MISFKPYCIQVCRERSSSGLRIIMPNKTIVFAVDEPVHLDETTSSRFLHLALVLSRNKMSVCIMGPHGSRSTAEGVPVMAAGPRFSSSFWGKCLTFLIFPFCLIPRIFKKDNVCFIVRGYVLGAVLIPWIRLLGKKGLYDFHDFTYQEQAYRRQWWLVPPTWACEQISVATATTVIAVSEGIKNKLPARIRKKTLVMPNGVDPARFEGTPGARDRVAGKYGLDLSGKTVIFNASRMPPWLKLSDLTEAARLLPESYQVVVCGDMPYADVLPKAGFSGGKVMFLGRVPFEDVMVILQDIADVAVNLYDADCYKSRIPFYFENRKMKEYLAAGKPIIVADVPAKEAFLKEGENALFYRSGDPRDLADKIRRVCEDPALAEVMGRNNRALSLEFTWEKIVERAGILNILINRHPEASAVSEPKDPFSCARVGVLRRKRRASE